MLIIAGEVVLIDFHRYYQQRNHELIETHHYLSKFNELTLGIDEIFITQHFFSSELEIKLMNQWLNDF
jgi:hypothetical protein